MQFGGKNKKLIAFQVSPRQKKIFFLGPHLRHMEVPGLGVESDLQLPAYTTATRDQSRACDLHSSSWQRQILNLLSEARDGTSALMDASQACFC